MKSIVIGFGLLIAALLILFQVARLKHFQLENSSEAWVVIFSGIFLIIGIILSRKLFVPKPRIIEKEITKEPLFEPDQNQLSKLGLSKRELEMLHLINDGLSNQQIAGKLFVSENTVKKHISNLFLKLDVERRTEAIKKGKNLKIID